MYPGGVQFRPGRRDLPPDMYGSMVFSDNGGYHPGRCTVIPVRGLELPPGWKNGVPGRCMVTPWGIKLRNIYYTKYTMTQVECT